MRDQPRRRRETASATPKNSPSSGAPDPLLDPLALHPFPMVTSPPPVPLLAPLPVPVPLAPPFPEPFPDPLPPPTPPPPTPPLDDVDPPALLVDVLELDDPVELDDDELLLDPPQAATQLLLRQSKSAT